MTIHATIATARADPLAATWRRHGAALAILAVTLLALFAGDVRDIVTIWWTSSTYGHCMLVGPIIVWLVWQRWPQLRALEPRAWAPGLMVVAVGGFGWLLGDAAGVALARHLGLALMLQGAAIACLGPSVTRGILFPLAYMIFLVPMGEELVPPLQTLTAKMCMALLALAGVPAHIEGVFITIPNGWFEVAEACSGVRFLVAMAAYGILVANVCFRSWGRRIAFVAAAVALSILANGVRAWATIYVAYLTDPGAAEGFDHVVYGWIFFAIVIGLLMAIGWRFFDRRPGDAWFDPATLRSEAKGQSLPLVAAGAILLAALPLGWSAQAARGGMELPNRIALPAVPGWTRVTSEAATPWRPHFAGADHRLFGRYRDGQGRIVDLAVALYGRQAEGRELVGYGQGAIDPASDWAWTDAQPAPPVGQAFRISAPRPVMREVVMFYRVGGVTTGSEAEVKLETLKVRLLGGDQRASAVLVSAEGKQARPAIDAFLRALGPVDRLADAVADRAAGR